jgi:rod shape determining protein RodA
VNKGSSIRDYDWFLLATAFAICGVGVLEIWSATHASHLAGMHTHQLEWIGLGFVLMLALSRLDYHTILDQAPILYLIAIIALIAVLAMGHTRFGAKRWLPIRFFSEVRTEHLSLGDLIKTAALMGLPLALIMLQPDLGTALVLVPLAAVGAFLAGLQWKHSLAIVALAAIMVPVGYHFLKPYQRERVTTFLRPEEDPRGAGYQILQSKIAVGSGGFWGKGLGNGSQNQLGFVPVRYSDFILAALAEELGFAGVFVALLLYMFLLLRLVHNAQRAHDRAGMFLIMGVAAVLGFHVLVNVAMVIGFMPVTGIPLPLMSYGGSATLFVFLALGLVMNVRIRRFVN